MTDFTEAALAEMRNADPAKLYMGSPCRYGHSGLRYLAGKDCVVCSRGRSKAWRRGHTERRDYDKEKARKKYASLKHPPVMYVMYSPGLNLYKIGTTTRIKRRETEIRTACPDVQTQWVLPCGGRNVELILHDTFAHCRVAGSEWFRLDDVTQVIQAVYRIFGIKEVQ